MAPVRFFKIASRILAVAIGVGVVGLGATYCFWPWLAQPILSHFLQPYGVSELVVRIDRPGWSGVKVDSLSFNFEGHRMSAMGVTLGYSLTGLRAGRVSMVKAERLDVVLSSETASDAPEFVWPAGLWSALPFESVSVESASIGGLAVDIEGQLSMAAAVLEAKFAIDEADAEVQLHRDGEFAVQLTDDFGSRIRLDGSISADHFLQAGLDATLTSRTAGRYLDLSDIDAEVDIGQYSTPIRLDALGQADFGVGTARARGTVEAGGMRIPFEADYHGETSTASLAVDHRLNVTDELLASFFPALESSVDVPSATLAVSAIAHRTPESGIDADVSLDLESAFIGFDPLAVDGFSARLRGRYTNAQFRLEPLALAAEKVDAGFVVESLTATLLVDPMNLEVIRVRSLAGKALGGSLAAGGFDLDTKRGTASFDLHLDGIDLAKALAFQGGAVAGTGKLDGVIPVGVRSGVLTVSDGRIAARPPGGRVQLTSVEDAAPLADRVGMEFATQALTDFRYDRLEADVNYAAEGVLRFGIRMEGHNPEVAEGRGIQYNVNVEQDLNALLKSVRLHGNFEAQLESASAKAVER